MNRIKLLLLENARYLRAAFRCAPFEAALGYIVALVFSVALVAEESDIWETWARLALGAALALPIMLSASIGAHTRRVADALRWTLTGGALALALAYTFVWFDPDNEASAWQALLLMAASWGALLASPSLTVREGDNPRAWFWQGNERLSARVSVVLSFALLLYAGLAGALAAVNALFDANLGPDPFGHLFGATFFALVPSLIVGGLPEITTPVGRAPTVASRGARWSGAYLAAPLLLTYVVILYAYNVKVVTASVLPSNALSPLALGASAIGLLGWIVVDPIHGEEDPPLSARVMRWFPAMFLPLLPLPFWAIWLRVEQYGWTQFRYIRMLALLGTLICCVLGCVHLLRKRAAPIAAVPAVFAALALVGAMGPLSANEVSRRSQVGVLFDTLEALDLLTDAGTLDNDATPLFERAGADRDELERMSALAGGAARFLSRSFGDDVLRTLLQPPEGVWPIDALAALDVEPNSRFRHAEQGPQHVWAELPRGTSLRVDVAGTHTLVEVPQATQWITHGDVGLRGTDAPLAAWVRSDDTGECAFALDGICDWALAHPGFASEPLDTLQLDPAQAVVVGDSEACGVLVLHHFSADVEAFGLPEARCVRPTARGTWVRP